nr:hypothetical protein [Dorea longicatena]
MGKGLAGIIVGHIIGCLMLFLAGVIAGKLIPEKNQKKKLRKMAAVPVVNNLLAHRPFFMIKIHRQNLSTFIKILICLLFNKII